MSCMKHVSHKTITILDIIDNSVFCLKHDVSEIWFCLCLQVEPTHLDQWTKIVSASGELYILGPTEYVAPEDEERIQSPERRAF
jgi:hypothetical protein